MKHLNILLLLVVCMVLVACNNEDSDAVTDGDIDNQDVIDGDMSETDSDVETTPPLELTTDLCDDPSNLQAVMEALQNSGGGGMFGGANQEQFERMMAAPTDGPFYMFNLLRYREWA